MAGTNVTQMLAFMQETIQVQQNTMLKDSVATKNTKKPDFDEFLQVSTANVNSQKCAEVPITSGEPKESVTEERLETTDVVKGTAETSESITETSESTVETSETTTETSNSIKKEEMDDAAKKNIAVVMNTFQSKVEQMVIGNLQQDGIADLTVESGKETFQPENVIDLPDATEVPETLENPKVEVTPENGLEQTLVTGKTENDMLQQNETSEEKQQQILDLGNLEIRFQFSDKEGVSINIPDEVVTEGETDIADKLVINVELSEDLEDVLESIQSQLVQKIVDNFHVTEEEVTEAMETLAIQFFDLTNSDKLKELAVYLSKEENLVSMVTNEQLFTAYKETEAGIEGIMAIQPEDLVGVLEELSEKVEQLQVELLEVQIPEEVVTLQEPEVMPEMESVKNTLKTERIVSEQNQQEIIPVEVEAVDADGTVEGQPKQETVKEQEVVSVKGDETSVETGDVQQEQSNSSQNGSQKETGNGNVDKAETPSTAQSSTTFSTVVTETEVQTVVTTQRTDFDGIVRQIVEQVKVQIKPDTVSMDLQLNPESLGKVSLHVSSKEGAVTAQLLVQNEAVKAAIEGQLTMLREAMQQQGIKVDAVEVAVETGDFGRSLEQQSQQGREEANQQSKTFRSRGINLLSGIDEENMNEEELLRAHIMRESGNSVDMNA